MLDVFRAAARTTAAFIAVALVWLASSAGGFGAVLANTVLVMGGNANPHGTGMERELGGYLSTAPGTAYAGYDYRVVPWPAQALYLGPGTMTYGAAESAGIRAVDAAIAREYVPGSKLVVAGYSSSADVVTDEMRALQARRDAGANVPGPEDLSFVVLGSPARPNGGIFARFPGAHVPWPLDVSFDPAAPATDYQSTDISWEYDPISDFPVYPLNVIADLNAIVAFVSRHSFYFGADPTDSAAVVQDVVVGNTRYITIGTEHLPLLEPLYGIGVPAALLDAVEPALKYLVDLGYDRSISPATPTPARLTPPPVRPVDVAAGIADALGDGVRAALPAPAPRPPRHTRPRERRSTVTRPDTIRSAPKRAAAVAEGRGKTRAARGTRPAGAA